jgi:hypothetical protein
VLGGLPKQDGPAIAAALAASFKLDEYEGRVRATWVPRSYSGLINAGPSVTGAQASLATFARTALDQTLPLIDSLTPLDVGADPQDVDAMRAILRATWMELVDELGTEGGPRVARADQLAHQLAGDGTKPFGGFVQFFGQLLGVLKNGELDRSRVVLTSEETTLTDFIVVSDYIRNIVNAWNQYKATFGGTPAAARDLGSGLVRVERALTVIDEAVDEVYAALDSVFVGPDERLTTTFPLTIGTAQSSMAIEELLSWVQSFARTEAPALIENAGTYGVEVVGQTIKTDMGSAVAAFVAFVSAPNGRARNALHHPRVQNSVAELGAALNSARDAAAEVVEQPVVFPGS